MVNHMVHPRLPLDFHRLPINDMRARAIEFHAEINCRRTVRDFSAEPVPRDIIERCIAAAGCAPSGANQQPWRFVVIGNAAIKKTIRDAAENEEREFYDHRITEAWREALAPLGTNDEKPFLEIAP